MPVCDAKHKLAVLISTRQCFVIHSYTVLFLFSVHVCDAKHKFAVLISTRQCFVIHSYTVLFLFIVPVCDAKHKKLAPQLVLDNIL